MAVFPESMSKLDKEDVAASLATLESYIHYMAERIEFANASLTRKVNALETKGTEG